MPLLFLLLQMTGNEIIANGLIVLAAFVVLCVVCHFFVRDPPVKK